MRLAILASGFGDYSAGLAAAFAARAEVALFADAAALEREGIAPPPEVETHLFRQDSALRRWGGAAALVGRLARWRPQAVLAHEHAHPHLTQLHRAAGRLAPLGLIVHDVEPHPGRDAGFAALRRRDTAAQRRNADRLFVHGEAAARDLAARQAKPVAAIAHGPLLRREAPPPPPGRGRLLMFGRMEAYKGLDVLLDAHRRLAGEGVVLDLRGEGPELARLERAFIAAGRCEIARRRATRAELLAALAASDLVLAPYLQASGSGVAAAAMANGRGLVASAVGGLAEVVRPGREGVLVPPGDAHALAAAIRAALPRAEAFGRAALARSRGELAWSGAGEIILGEMDRARQARAA